MTRLDHSIRAIPCMLEVLIAPYVKFTVSWVGGIFRHATISKCSSIFGSFPGQQEEV